jgi:hypothetical protein
MDIQCDRREGRARQLPDLQERYRLTHSQDQCGEYIALIIAPARRSCSK